MLGIPTAQVSLSFGADDIDGTVVHEKIYHDAGSDSPEELTVAEIRRLIEEAGRVPVERDTLYHEVVRENGDWQTGMAIRPEPAGVFAEREVRFPITTRMPDSCPTDKLVNPDQESGFSR